MSRRGDSKRGRERGRETDRETERARENERARESARENEKMRERGKEIVGDRIQSGMANICTSQFLLQLALGDRLSGGYRRLTTALTDDG